MEAVAEEVYLEITSVDLEALNGEGGVPCLGLRGAERGGYGAADGGG